MREAEYCKDSDVTLEMNVYYPPGPLPVEARLPVVVLVTGHADPVIETVLFRGPKKSARELKNCAVPYCST